MQSVVLRHSSQHSTSHSCKGLFISKALGLLPHSALQVHSCARILHSLHRHAVGTHEECRDPDRPTLVRSECAFPVWRRCFLWTLFGRHPESLRISDCAVTSWSSKHNSRTVASETVVRMLCNKNKWGGKKNRMKYLHFLEIRAHC